MASVNNLESQSLAQALEITHNRFQQLGLPFAFCGDVAYKIYNKTAGPPEVCASTISHDDVITHTNAEYPSSPPIPGVESSSAQAVYRPIRSQAFHSHLGLEPQIHGNKPRNCHHQPFNPPPLFCPAFYHRRRPSRPLFLHHPPNNPQTGFTL